MTTKTTKSVSVPSEVEAGDAPFDTTDPSERVSSVSPDKAAAAAAGFGTVNAVVPLPKADEAAAEQRKDRVEKYDVLGPNGKFVSVEHNIDTGATKRV